MTAGPTTQEARGTTEAGLDHNRLLTLLPAQEREALAELGEVVDLEVRDMLYEADAPVTAVYFPLAGVMSMVQVMAGDAVVEIATVGKEGMIGLPAFLGSLSTSSQAFCQIPGAALRVSSEDFRRVLGQGTGLRDVMQRFTQALITTIAQNTACNASHTIEQRAARWLLMTHDRVDRPRFPLTQQFLAQMLGVRRAGVNEIAASLRKQDLIHYRRGEVEILDADGLREVACECYDIIENEFARLLDGALGRAG